MNESQIPAPDADSSRDAVTASAPTYPQRATAQDHSTTQELPPAQDATREMPTPSADTRPRPRPRRLSPRRSSSRRRGRVGSPSSARCS